MGLRRKVFGPIKWRQATAAQPARAKTGLPRHSFAAAGGFATDAPRGSAGSFTRTAAAALLIGPSRTFCPERNPWTMVISAAGELIVRRLCGNIMGGDNAGTHI